MGKKSRKIKGSTVKEDQNKAHKEKIQERRARSETEQKEEKAQHKLALLETRIEVFDRVWYSDTYTKGGNGKVKDGRYCRGTVMDLVETTESGKNIHAIRSYYVLPMEMEFNEDDGVLDQCDNITYVEREGDVCTIIVRDRFEWELRFLKGDRVLVYDESDERHWKSARIVDTFPTVKGAVHAYLCELDDGKIIGIETDSDDYIVLQKPLPSISEIKCSLTPALREEVIGLRDMSMINTDETNMTAAIRRTLCCP
jgi:hypothetical protein